MCSGPGRVQTQRWEEEAEVQGCVRHHQHHGEDGGAKEPVQWPGGRAAEADELRFRAHWTL